MSMRITKYPQSCLLLEKNGKRLLIDPGNFVVQKYKPEDLLPIDGILITHEHADHAHPELIGALSKNDIPVIANDSTKKLLGDLVTNTIVDEEELEVAGFRVMARELPHCLLVDGSSGPQNTGYVIDGVFFHPGDGKELAGLSVETAAIPIFGPDISFKDSYDFARQLQCRAIIPIHNDVVQLNPDVFKSFVGRSELPFEVIALQNGQTTDV